MARRGADHARGVRQRRAQRHRLPLHGHLAQRDLRRLSLRRGADALLPAAPAGRRAAAQVQDRVRGLHRGSRAGVDQRHRLARENPGRPARLPRDDCRRHVDHAGDRLRALRVPAGGGDAERGRGRAARLPQVRRLRAPAAQPHEVRGEAAWLGAVPRQGDGGARGVPRHRRCAAQADVRAAQAAGSARLAAGGCAVGEGRRRGGGDARHRPRHHARLGEAADHRRSVRAVGPDQRGAAEAGGLSPRDRPAAARRHDRGPDARARRSRRGVWRRHHAADGGTERAVQVGEEGDRCSRSTSGLPRPVLARPTRIRSATW